MNKQRPNTILVRFYNAVAQTNVETVEDIPPEVMQVLAGLNYRHLVEPFIVFDIRAGLNSRQLEVKYGVARSSIRRIGAKYELKVG